MLLKKKKWVNEEIKREIKKYLDMNDENDSQSVGCRKSSMKSKVRSEIGLPQKRRKISYQQPNLPPKRIRKKYKQNLKSAEGRKS